MHEAKVEDHVDTPVASPGIRTLIWPSLALLVVYLLGLLQARWHFDGPLVFALIVLWLAVPLGLLTIYRATIHRIHSLGAFAPGSVAVRFLRGIWLRVVIGWVLSLA
jgi:hypothetical protein